ncbi:MAG TPA: hypothetical protein VFX18_06230, partial [Candidatus Nitrosocosmicus sp.]|nr:hypothetical protein [Candidatus Nitrosocosmicus sp.]
LTSIVPDTDKCPTCKTEINNAYLIYDLEVGEQICKGCGTVLGEQRNNDFFTPDSFLDIYDNIKDTVIIEDRSNHIMGHESRLYGSRGSGLSGSGCNIITSYTEAMDFSSAGILSSMINKQNLDHMGAKIKDTKTQNRLRYMNSIINSKDRNGNEKNAKQVILLIKQISGKRNFPQYIQERTVNLYRKISEKNNVKRLQYKITAYWCLYYTLRQENLTPSLPEFLSWLVDMGYIEPGKKTSVQKKINKVQIFILDLMEMDPVQHSDFISNVVYLCNKYHLNEMIKRQCLELNNVINDFGGSLIYQGRSPKTITTMLIAIIMKKEGLNNECNELLKDLKITPMILKKIINQIIESITKNNERTEKLEDLKNLLLSY